MKNLKKRKPIVLVLARGVSQLKSENFDFFPKWDIVFSETHSVKHYCLFALFQVFLYPPYIILFFYAVFFFSFVLEKVSNHSLSWHPCSV